MKNIIENDEDIFPINDEDGNLDIDDFVDYNNSPPVYISMTSCGLSGSVTDNFRESQRKKIGDKSDEITRFLNSFT